MKRNNSFITGIRGNQMFAPLLTQWIKLQEKYGECWKWDDCAWYHREVSSVSFFAGAVWTVGGLVLQEYSTTKMIDGKKADGRCDLYFGLPRPDGTFQHFDAEAKHDWYLLDGSKPGTLETIKRTLDRASNDAANISDASQRLGICFISFCVENARIKTLSTTELRAAEASLSKFIADVNSPGIDWFDAAAWFFAEDHNLANCPGVAVFVRSISDEL
jgi:hypothetical protein